MTQSRSTVFESFNARFLEPEQVGSHFVLSPHLEDTILPVHSAILGPRGSGKTTLLKMLTLPALLNWTSDEGRAITERVSYLSVYVPYSLTWSADYRGFSRFPIEPQVEELLSVALFRHNFLISLLDTWNEASAPPVGNHQVLKAFYLPIERTREVELVERLARAWGLTPRISTVTGLRESITDRLRILQRLTVSAAGASTSFEKILNENPFLGDHFLDDAAAYADFLAEKYNFRQKIALCFDELEIASDSIARAILSAPRSVDQRFLIKFSTAPYVGIASKIGDPKIPTQANDYKLIFLSSFSAQATRNFSEALFKSICHQYGVEATASAVLGPSFIDESADRRPSGAEGENIHGRYAASGGYQKKFQSLYDRDETFRRYIDGARPRSEILDLTSGSENERASRIRKVIWPVLVREEFLFKQEGIEAGAAQRRRLKSSSSVSDIYTGAASLFAICEGNPRSIIGLMDPMAQDYSHQKDPARIKSVRRSQQKELLSSLISAYFALLSTVPSGTAVQGLASLLDIVYRVGEFFKGSILGPDFNPDPVLSFVVDDQVSAPVQQLIGRGINIGAFVTTNERLPARELNRGHAYRVGEVVGLKTRLSNIFAPHFRLPLAGGRTVNLSTIISRKGPGKDRGAPLLEIFGDRP